MPVQERDANNNITREYTWGLNMGGGIGGLLGLRQAGMDYAYLYDNKGNVMSLLDNGQNVVADYRYDPFGNLMRKTATVEQPYMFSTKPYDPQTGLYDYGFRFYDPATGKWTTKDPLGEAGGVNLYGFVNNNGVNFVDPLGLWTLSVEAGAGLTIFGFGGNGMLGINIGHSEKDGWSLSLSGTAQGGFSAGLGTFAGFGGTYTNASNINQLNGESCQFGRSGLGLFAIEGVKGSDYKGATGYVGLRKGATGYTAGSITQSTTSAIFQYDRGYLSIGNTGSASIWRWLIN